MFLEVSSATHPENTLPVSDGWIFLAKIRAESELSPKAYSKSNLFLFLFLFQFLLKSQTSFVPHWLVFHFHTSFPTSGQDSVKIWAFWDQRLSFRLIYLKQIKPSDPWDSGFLTQPEKEFLKIYWWFRKFFFSYLFIVIILKPFKFLHPLKVLLMIYVLLIWITSPPR